MDKMSELNSCITYLEKQLSTYRRIAEINESIIRMMFLWLNNPSDEALENVFNIFHCNKIAVYGYSRLGQILVKKLENTKIDVNYIIDRNKKLNVPGYSVVHPEDKLPTVDAIIITNVYDFDSIHEELLMTNDDVNVLSLADLLCML